MPLDWLLLMQLMHIQYDDELDPEPGSGLMTEDAAEIRRETEPYEEEEEIR